MLRRAQGLTLGMMAAGVVGAGPVAAATIVLRAWTIGPEDAAITRAQALKPGVGYMTPEYQQTLREEIVRIARADPAFVARTLLAKCWVLFRLLFYYANFGLLAALVRPKGWATESAFGSALAFGALSGVLVLPSVKYTLGFIALAALYGLFGLNRWPPSSGPRHHSIFDPEGRRI